MPDQFVDEAAGSRPGDDPNGDGLRGRRALVTGASRGIGAAIARRLHAAGARVVLVARGAADLDPLAAELSGAIVRAADVGDPVAVAELFESLETAPDILVNNAGAARSAPLHRTTDELWRQMLEVNLSGVFHCCRAALPAMLERGRGRIVNVASTAGLRGYPYVAAYSAAKHGVVGLTRSLALEVARRGVTVNAVCPGFTETELLDDSLANIVRTTGRSPEEAKRELLRSNPQGRFVRPEEVADAVAFLVSDTAAAINGHALAVAGGEV